MNFKLANFQVIICLSLLSAAYSVSGTIVANKWNPGRADSHTLVLVNVLFRHGNRTPSLTELYPKDPYLNYTYWPFGNGQLTNVGKRKEYSIGEALRIRYHSFLGETYYPDLVDSRSTDYNRTKMSLELVHASLFEPKNVEKWKQGLNWQPVPYNYVPTNKDKVLLGLNCPTFIKLYDEYVNSSGFQGQLSPYQEIFKYISENTGLNVTSFREVYNLYFGLSTEEEWGFKLPKWTKPVWPKNITDLAIKQYYAETGTKELASFVNGYFLGKLISDAQAKIAKLPEKYGRKLYLYSAHENNIGELLVFLNIFGTPHIPTYGSYLIFELHHINNTYGFKIFYQHYEPKGIEQLILPNCEAFCPLDKFINLYKDYIPTDEMCGN